MALGPTLIVQADRFWRHEPTWLAAGALPAGGDGYGPIAQLGPQPKRSAQEVPSSQMLTTTVRPDSGRRHRADPITGEWQLCRSCQRT